MRKRAEDRSPGFSLLEALLSLTIFFLIFAGSLEFFGTARRSSPGSTAERRNTALIRATRMRALKGLVT